MPIVPGTTPTLTVRLSAMLQEFGIPKDASAVFALQALIGEGLSLGAEAIKAVRTIALYHGEPRRAAVLAARALAAGLQPGDDGMDALIRSLAGSLAEDSGKEPDRVSSRQSGKHTGSGSGKDPDGESQSDSGRDPDRQPGRDDRRNPDDRTPRGQEGQGSGQGKADDMEGRQASSSQVLVQRECRDEPELQKALESAFMAMASRAASDPGFSALARKGPDGHGWLCVPYRFSVDGVDFSGYFRIIFNYASNKVERLVAEIDSSGLTRVFDVSLGPAGKPKLRFRPGSAAEGWDFLRVFGESMKVELIPQGDDPALIDTVYQEVDGHA